MERIAVMYFTMCMLKYSREGLRNFNIAFAPLCSFFGPCSYSWWQSGEVECVPNSKPRKGVAAGHAYDVQAHAFPFSCSEHRVRGRTKRKVSPPAIGRSSTSHSIRGVPWRCRVSCRVNVRVLFPFSKLVLFFEVSSSLSASSRFTVGRVEQQFILSLVHLRNNMDCLLLCHHRAIHHICFCKPPGMASSP